MLHYKQLEATFTKAGGRTFNVVLSTSELDREKDGIDAAGWTIPKRVPLLFGHDATKPPVGRVTNIHVVGNALRGQLEFPAEGISQFADEIARLVDAGFLASTSVGFRALRPPRRNDAGGLDFDATELCELSLVNVPANVSAVVERGDGEVLRKWYGGEGDVVLELDDDELMLELDDRIDLAEFRDVWRDAVGTAIRTGVQQALTARRFSEPLSDPATRRHRTDLVDVVDASEVKAAVADVIPQVIRQVVQDAVRQTLARMRGRVD